MTGRTDGAGGTDGAAGAAGADRSTDDRLVECIPNFSEGRDAEIIEEIVGAIKAVPGVTLLDHYSDHDHNRLVVTFVGTPEAAKAGAFAGIEKATALIDMERHQGAHPRIGATDVVPFVPVRGVTIGDCVQLAKELGREVSAKLQVPVYLYGEAAQRPERANLAKIRKGQYETLKDEIVNTDRHPDFGEPQMHPRAGAVVIGARQALIAFNINLNSSDLKLARAIAKRVRESGGGYPSIKGAGIPVSDRGLVQVSMNVEDFNITSLWTIFSAVKAEAAKEGVEVVESEIVGLLPLNAVLGVARDALQLRDFDSEQILELRVAKADGGSS